MALEFAKTAPGVMTATWTHPNSGRAFSVAVIESCETWHTFIDGELIARDQPSFDVAVAAAEKKLTRKATSRMVRVAGILVIASSLGASAVIASKFMPHVTGSELAAVAKPERAITPATEALAQAPASPALTTVAAPQTLPTHDTRLAAVAPPPPPVKSGRAAAAPVSEAAASDGAAQSSSSDTFDSQSSETVAAATGTSAGDTVDRALRPADRAALAAVGQAQPAPAPERKITEPRRFSAENNLLSLEGANDRAAPHADATAATPPAAPLATRDTAPHAEAAAPAGQQALAAPRVVPMDPPAPAATGSGDDVQKTNVNVAAASPVPPLPEAAPAAAEPRVQVAATTIESDFPDKSVSERSGAPASTKPGSTTTSPDRDGAPRPARRSRTERRARPRHDGERSRSRHHKYERREHHLRTAAPGQRLVCFAHVCRWR